MIVRLKVIANAKQNLICGFNGGYLKVKVSKPALDGKANEALIVLMSSFFEIRKSKIKILSGEKSHIKTLEIPINEKDFNFKIQKVISDANL
ncbi:MAG: DUF167 domain-containing protein [Desulfurella sp.]|uniref:DUF167 domain-containing protein n=1 Tax=Desulfurella sp. TaxID=1962857 RepID=UPI003CA5CB63